MDSGAQPTSQVSAKSSLLPSTQNISHAAVFATVDHRYELNQDPGDTRRRRLPVLKIDIPNLDPAFNYAWSAPLPSSPSPYLRHGVMCLDGAADPTSPSLYSPLLRACFPSATSEYSTDDLESSFGDNSLNSPFDLGIIAMKGSELARKPTYKEHRLDISWDGQYAEKVYHHVDLGTIHDEIDASSEAMDETKPDEC